MAYFIPNDVFEGMNEGVCSEKTSLEIPSFISHKVTYIYLSLYSRPHKILRTPFFSGSPKKTRNWQYFI